MKKILFFISFTITSLLVVAQDIPLPRAKAASNARRTSIEFYAGATINSEFNFTPKIGIGPEIGAKLTDWLYVGVRPFYNAAITLSEDRVNIWGVGPYLEFNAGGLLFHFEYNYSQYRYKEYDYLGFEHSVANLQSVVTGMGYLLELSDIIEGYGLISFPAFRWGVEDPSEYFSLQYRIGLRVNL